MCVKDPDEEVAENNEISTQWEEQWTEEPDVVIINQCPMIPEF